MVGLCLVGAGSVFSSVVMVEDGMRVVNVRKVSCVVVAWSLDIILSPLEIGDADCSLSCA